MKKLKILFHYRNLLILFLITYIYISINLLQVKTNYNEDHNEMSGYIDSINIDENKISLEVIGLEKVTCTYYINNKNELDEITNYKLGDYLKLIGEFKKPSSNNVFNLFNYKNYLYSKKIYWTFKIDKIEKLHDNKMIRYKIKNTIIERIDNIEKSGNYVKAFVLGDTSQIKDSILEDYRNIGISHLFSISGSNITLLAAIILFIFKKSKLKYTFVIVFLMYNIFLTSYSAPVLRATLLFILIYLNKKFNLKIKTYDLLTIIAYLLLIYNPYYIYNIGFIFSFSISMFLILFKDLINKYKNYFTKLVIISIISFLVSIPVMINNFFIINPLSIIYNLFFVPYVSIIVFPLSLITFLFPFLDNTLFILINILETISVFCSKTNLFNIVLASMPFYITILYYILITFVIYKFSQNKPMYILIIFLTIFIHNNIIYFSKYSSITVLDVGEGDSILISLKHNKGNILIDTGGLMNYNNDNGQKKDNNFSLSKSIIVPYLKSLGIKKLNYLVISHGDFDHMGESVNLVNNFKVDNVIFNIGEFNDLEQELIKILDEKKIKYYKGLKELNIDDNKLYFLNTGIYDNENDNSNVLYFNYNNYKFLFMGDAGIKREKDILDKYNLTAIDFLKVGHHGSNTSSSEQFIDKINPSNCLISAGKYNRYGHPKQDVLDILNICNIYRTDLNGSVEIKLNKNNYKIKTYNP